MNNKILFTFAGWEERFVLGAEDILKKENIKCVVMFYVNKYNERTQDNKNKLQEVLRNLNIRLSPIEITYENPQESWKELSSYITNTEERSNCIIDLSTMPRETIWHLLLLLNAKQCQCEYYYYRPKTYGEWLTENTGTPRLSLKLSGVTDLSKKTMLIVATGFDPARTKQVCNFFEPEKVFFAIEQGKQFDNDKRNREQHLELAQECGAEIVNINCYGKDCGERILSSVVKKNIKNYNIILTSLGPKLTAIPLFKIHSRFPHVALCYAPSQDMNIEYSSGCLEALHGIVF